ncbi:MAG: hypothetical protein KDD40_09455 [Bdellovibrionales bacterium]|nr:hypothetical protein [Bdellovibrionales bacterium]
MKKYKYNFSDMQFVFNDIGCKAKLNQNICRIAESIQRQAPNNSFIKITFEKQLDQYITQCRICALTKTFSAIAIAPGMEESMKLLELRIAKKLNLWKQERVFKEINKAVLA